MCGKNNNNYSHNDDDDNNKNNGSDDNENETRRSQKWEKIRTKRKNFPSCLNVWCKQKEKTIEQNRNQQKKEQSHLLYFCSFFFVVGCIKLHNHQLGNEMAETAPFDHHLPHLYYFHFTFSSRRIFFLLLFVGFDCKPASALLISGLIVCVVLRSVCAALWCIWSSCSLFSQHDSFRRNSSLFLPSTSLSLFHYLYVYVCWLFCYNIFFLKIKKFIP